jgi:hypothetical protein
MARQNEFSPATAVVSLLIACAAMVMTGWHWYRLSQDLSQAKQSAVASKEDATASLLGTFSLPQNHPLQLCNETKSAVQVTALAATYWAADGTLRQFNSAQLGWHTWQLEPGQKQNMQLAEGDGWDGSTIFFAAEVQHPGGSRTMLVGTSDEWKPGACTAVRME